MKNLQLIVYEKNKELIKNSSKIPKILKHVCKVNRQLHKYLHQYQNDLDLHCIRLIEKDNCYIFNKFIEKYPKFIKRCRYDWTSLHRASHLNSLKIVSLLMDKYPYLAYEETAYGETILHTVSCNNLNSLKMISLIIDKYPGLVYVTNQYGSTILHHISSVSYLKIVKLLIERYPDLVFIQNEEGKTALHNASWYNRLNIVKLLIEKYPSLVYVKDYRGNTALHSSISQYGNIEIIKYLVTKYPRLIDIRNNNGNTVLDIALRCNKLETVKLLKNIK